MKNIKKLTAVLLALAIFVSVFSGCGKKEKVNDGPEFIYVPTYEKLDLPEGVQWLGNVNFFDGKIYMMADVEVEVGKGEGDGEMNPAIGTDAPADLEEDADVDVDIDYVETKYLQKLYSIDADGKNVTELATFGDSNNISENIEYYEWVNGIAKTAEGVALIISASTTTYNLPEDFDPEIQNKWEFAEYKNSFIIRNIDASGNLGEGKVVFEFSENEEFYPDNMICGGNGNWYVSSWQEIRVYDKDFNQLYSIPCPDGTSGLVELGDGRVGGLFWSENGTEMKIIDDSKKALGEKIDLPENVYSFRSGNGVYDLVYEVPSGGGLSAYDIETGESEALLNWIDSDLDRSSVQSDRVFIVDEENLIAIEATYDSEVREYNLITLKKTPASELPQKETITLAGVYLSYDLQKSILKFNKTNSQYKIRPIDYSQYASGDDPLGLTKLNTEIISGNIPDIFVTDNLPMGRYGGKGIFEDLTPYIEESIGFDKLVEPFFDSLRTEEGKLYEIFESFNIYTYVGHKDAVGDGSSWTFEDLKEAQAKLPEGATVFEDYLNKSGAFSILFSNNIDSFINWETGECSFTSDEFIDILEFTENFPLEQPEMDESYYMYYYDPIIKVAKGEQLLANYYFYDIDDFRARTFYVLGDKTSFVGRPSNNGTGNSFSAYNGFAMSASSKYKDVAWEFIGNILTEEYQTKEYYYNGLPTNKVVFDKLMEKSMTAKFDEFYDPEENGMNINTTITYDVAVEGDIAIDAPMAPALPEGEGDSAEEENSFTLPDYTKGQTNEKGWHETPKTYEYPVYAMTEAEYEAIMELIETTKTFSRYDESVLKIVMEEVEYFFNGERTAQQTAEYIQSRVKLYVNEQR